MTVQSVVRAFDILKFVTANPQGIGVTDIAEQTELHKSTVSRLLSTLESLNVVQRVPNELTFQVAPIFAAQFQHGENAQNLIALAQPYLRELSLALGEDVGIAVRDGDEAVYITQVLAEEDHSVRVRDWTGIRFPMHHVSAGRIFLAYETLEFQASYLNRWADDDVANVQALPAVLTQVRQDEVVWLAGEIINGLGAVAVPLFGRNNDVIAALGAYGPLFRFPRVGEKAAIANTIKEVGAKLTRHIQQSTHIFEG